MLNLIKIILKRKVFKMEKQYNENEHTLTLVTEVKGEELITKTFSLPAFISGTYTKSAIDLGAELDEKEYVVQSDLFDRLSNFIVDLFGKQFTVSELQKGLHAGEIIETYIAILMGILQGNLKKA